MASKTTAAVLTDTEISSQCKADFAQGVIKEMKRQRMSFSELARRMGTSRAVVHRMLKDRDPSLTLVTMGRAAAALRRSVRIRLAA